MISKIIFDLSPIFFQDILISFYNTYQYKKRYSEKYIFWKDYYKKYEFSTAKILKIEQQKRFDEFIRYSKENSKYYSFLSGEINEIDKYLSKIPILTKEDLRNHANSIITIPKKQAYVSKTGGTTGKSLQVLFRWDDFQERMAMLDLFRERFVPEYKNKRMAWFSGKYFKKGVNRKIFWRNDFINRIRFYSTFHINHKTIDFYIENIKKFKPEIIVGFPSSLYEIAEYALNNNITLGYKLLAIFPTAETLLPERIDIISKFFGCGVFDQYASSEGAPFVTECESGNLHYEVLTGVIEIIDEEGHPSREGEVLLTSFSTRGTPLIRYAIKDSMKWSDKACDCGRHTPLIEYIHGRTSDFIYSKERGKVYLGNLSNSLKDVKNIVKFQIIQNDKLSISVKIICDEKYNNNNEQAFLKNLRERVGESLEINLHYVNEIPREKSGKYRIVINNLSLKSKSV